MLKKIIIALILLLTILFVVNNVNAATYTISTSNSTSSIDVFLSDEDWENPSPLANGDTVIFKAGKYNLDLNVNKAIKLKANGKVTVNNIFISKNTIVTGFIVKEGFYAHKSNNISKNTIGYLQLFGSKSHIINNIIKGGLSVHGSNNVVKNNYISSESSIDGRKNIVTSNTFKKNVYIYDNNNKIVGNKVATNYKIFTSGKKNILKNNKQSYRDLALSNVGKISKGHVLSVKNVGTKSTKVCYIKIDNYDRTVYKIKVPALKKGKSTKVIIPKRIINKLKYRYYETTYYGGYIYLDNKNKNKDADLSNNRLD
ncbi:hypothetical protein, partial [Methanobrevibacter cuticularis]|uniref:hypothetical protein n=1 Tax=Methanobrevibacter cuticularis TaxID=47311 RepID=UPI000A527550